MGILGWATGNCWECLRRVQKPSNHGAARPCQSTARIDREVSGKEGVQVAKATLQSLQRIVEPYRRLGVLQYPRYYRPPHMPLNTGVDSQAHTHPPTPPTNNPGCGVQGQARRGFENTTFLQTNLVKFENADTAKPPPVQRERPQIFQTSKQCVLNL